MIAAVFLLPMLAATPPPVKLASPGFSVVNVDEKEGALFSEYFARKLEENGLFVTTSAEISAVLGVERQKQLLGCDEDSTSCIGELAGALGVDGVITGTVGKVGTGFTLSLKIVSAKDASSMATYSTRLEDEDAVFEYLEATAKDVAGKLSPRGRQEAGATLRDRAWIPAAAGGLLGIGSVFSFTQAAGVHRGIVEAPAQRFSDQPALDAEIAKGRKLETAGVVLATTGAAALVGAALMFALGGDGAAPPVTAAVAPGPEGAALVIRGGF